MVTHSQVGTVKSTQHPYLWDVMSDEYNALIKNNTWALVPRPPSVNIVRSMWLFRHKYHANGTLSRYKARMVANGSSQQLSIDYDETFSLVVKPATIQTPPSVVDYRFPTYVCHLQRSLYGLKHAPRAWFQRFAGYATMVVFSHNNIVLTASSTSLLQRIISSLHREFEMTDLVQICSRVTSKGSLAGGLQYLTFTRPDLSYVMQQKHTLSHSSVEAEYRGISNVVAETAWLHNLLLKLQTPLQTITLVYCDIVSAIYLFDNPVQHQRTKHSEIDIHFV
uniref:Ribonuclease H-like domain-containing protein n=1 Tax=Tanacetum cinerariifolium TaxID=118510 RepID=A0A6L2LN15_TANCI|nr:ribonuclease H-like domain-containing protein [Tanacetum cinerariifolium]